MSDKPSVVKELIKGLEKVQKLKEDSLESKFSKDNADVITWSDLISTPFNEWIVLKDKGVQFMRLKHATKECFFITEMNPDLSTVFIDNKKVAVFGLQVHDCKEVGKVVEGHLIELVENSKEYVVDDYFIYPKNFRHKPISKIKSKYEVEFLRPVNIKL